MIRTGPAPGSGEVPGVIFEANERIAALLR
jgi:hypothetical protein